MQFDISIYYYYYLFINPHQRSENKNIQRTHLSSMD